MGNQESIDENGFKIVQCGIVDHNSSFQKNFGNDNFSKHSNKLIEVNQNYKNSSLRGSKGLKNMLSCKQKNNYLQNNRNLLQNQAPHKHLNLSKDNQSFQAMRNLQKNVLNFNVQVNPQKIHDQMKKAYKYMKSFNILKKFEQKYSKEYPILILNKQSSIKALRQQIRKEKYHHNYFNFSEIYAQKQSNNSKSSNQEVEFEKQLQESAKQAYDQFMVLQRIEWVIIRLYQTGKHLNILKHIKQIDKLYQIKQSEKYLKEIDQFAKHIDALDIEFMDMLFYQLKSINLINQIHQTTVHQTIAEFKSNIINVKQLIMKNKSDNGDYERLKQLGMQIYKQNKVCFYILALNNQSFIPQLQPLNIPQNMCIMQILLQRYDAFAQLLQLNQLTVNILIDSKRTLKFNQLMNKNNNKWQRLNIKILKTQELPLLDIEGNFILDQNTDTVRMTSIGSTDLWNCIQQDIDELQKFEYFQVIEANNCLQMGFDCFLLGKTQKDKLQWSVKVYDPIQRLIELSFINSQINKSQLINKEQTLVFTPYPCLISQAQIDDKDIKWIKQNQLLHYIYGGHCLLNKSLVKKILQKNKEKQHTKLRKKVFKQGNESFIVFDRNFIDQAINQSLQKYFNKWGIFAFERQESYYSLLYKQKEGILDVQGCSRALSHYNMSQLDLSVNKFFNINSLQSIKCYIDPHVSLNRSGLDDIKLQIQRKINDILTLRGLNTQIFSGQKNSQLNASQCLSFSPSQVISSISQILILSNPASNSQQKITIILN